MPLVLCISFTDLANDPRVNRQIRALKARYDVVAAGIADPHIAGVAFVACARGVRTLASKLRDATQLLCGHFESHYWDLPHVRDLQRNLDAVRPDLVFANDIEALPLALRAARGAPVVFDAHEYAPREYDTLRWKLFRQRYTEYLFRVYLPGIAGMMTVAEGIAREYRRHFGIEPTVVYNAPSYQDLQPRLSRGNLVRMIHHGNAIPGRGIEAMFDVMAALDGRFRLDLMLIPAFPEYFARLEARAARDPRIRMLKPVAMPRVVGFANEYDVGLYLLQPSSFNNLHALPNKFFEFVQSRLAVAVGPSPEMAALIRRHGFGLIAPDFQPASLARELGALDAERINAMKWKAHEAARELCFERSEGTLIALAERALQGGPRPLAHA